MIRFILLALTLLATPAFANDPEDTLDRYFDILTERDFSNFGDIMATENMNDLKALMDKAIRYQASHGTYDLQRRIFGKKVTMQAVTETPASFYLDKLAESILDAAEAQKFYVDNRKVLGTVMEGDDTVHVIARLNMHQGSTETSDVMLYTLVKEGDDWKLTFPPTVKQILQVIETSYKQVR